MSPVLDASITLIKIGANATLFSPSLLSTITSFTFPDLGLTPEI